MSRRFAEDTDVSVSRSTDEMKRMLKAAGAAEIAVYEAQARSMVAFKLGAFFYRLTVPLDPKARDAGQDERRAWRLLILVVKAKLQGIREGVTTVEREFLSDMMAQGGATVHELLLPQLTAAREEGRMPATLMIEHHP